ncbi:MAG: Flp family type IVb pilin [Sphingomonadales bacterium]|nr:Flp family type IVb pilin [Sphingomonadales bacterium]
MRKKIEMLLRDQQGATAIEYGLILALIFLAMVGGVTALGSETSSQWNLVASDVSTAVSQATA